MPKKSKPSETKISMKPIKGREQPIIKGDLKACVSESFIDALEEEFNQGAIVFPNNLLIGFSKRKRGFILTYETPEDVIKSKLTVYGTGLRKEDIKKLERAFKKGKDVHGRKYIIKSIQTSEKGKK